MKEQNTLGVIELSSIHKGFEVQDLILKSTKTQKILARTICPGKFLIIVRGEISDVEAALRLAAEAGGYAVVNDLIISNVHESVFPALAGTTVLEDEGAEGLLVVETFSAAAAIRAADHAVKAGSISLLRVHVAMAIGGKGLIVATGNIEALRSAAEPAVAFLKEDGTLGGYSLISHPHPDVLNELL
jgi:microcompartment protein CcmL/EutN